MMIENYYWTFSATAQLVASVIALLFAAHVFAYNGLETQKAEESDLEDIIVFLETTLLKRLSFIAGIALVALAADVAVLFFGESQPVILDSHGLQVFFHPRQ